MVQVTLIGVGCSKSWKIEDDIIRMSRELGIPIQINKVMDLDRILEMNLEKIPAIKWKEKVWTYDQLAKASQIRELLMELDNEYKAG